MKKKSKNEFIQKLKHLQKSKSYKDLTGKIKTLWFLVMIVIAFLTKVLQYNFISYIFILILCAFLVQFLWRVIHPMIWRILSILVITVPACTWISVNSWKNIQKARGILFQPAKPGEFLIIVAEFDPVAKGIGINPTARIIERLESEKEKANIENTRIEKVPIIKETEKARRIGKIHNALFVIWGWYDDVGFSPKFTITKESRQSIKEVELKEIKAELREFDTYISEGLPGHTAYLVTFAIGQLYFWQGEYEKALRSFNIALENLEKRMSIKDIPPPEGISSLFFYRGSIYQLNNNYTMAIDDYSKAIEFDSMYAPAYNNRGLVHHKKGNLDQAILDFNKAIKLHPMSAKAYNNRGTVQYEKGNIASAILDFNKAIELDSMYAKAYYNRSIVYDAKNLSAQAVDDYERYLRLSPDTPDRLQIEKLIQDLKK